MKTHWLLYVEKMDKVLEEAFRQCVKCSLQSLLDHLVGDGTAGPTPLIAVATFLKNNKVSVYLDEFSTSMFLADDIDHWLSSYSPLKTCVDQSCLSLSLRTRLHNIGCRKGKTVKGSIHFGVRFTCLKQLY